MTPPYDLTHILYDVLYRLITHSKEGVSWNGCRLLSEKEFDDNRIWDVRNVINELVRGETGWSTFEEREKTMMEWIQVIKSLVVRR